MHWVRWLPVPGLHRLTIAVTCRYCHALHGCCLTLCKLLVLYYHICRINLLAILIRVAAGLDTSGHNYLQSLTEILFCKLSASSESHTADKICGGFVVVIVCWRICGQQPGYIWQLPWNCPLRNNELQDLWSSVPLR